MVKLAVVFTAALAALSGFVAADNCERYLIYCGNVLLKRGNYYSDIVNELGRAQQRTDSSHVNNSIFYCGAKGAITFQTYCSNGCIDGGAGHSDHC